ncbi:hypothetical protein [Nakamurella lactea]|uniref:hypothetical protein n=1 Tax=Nakamurella lactea TaxID=459515 RepID=UPI0003F8E1CC|nr:hypothetical protein [Nakamurella lactea]
MTNQDADSGLLEARYRRLLRVLPPAYRAVREQEMVDTFVESRYSEQPELADVTATYGRPSLAEKVSVLSLALRLRWGGVDAPARYRVRAEATRNVALLGLLMLALWAALMLQARWGGTPWWPKPEVAEPINSGNLWQVIAPNAPVLWIPAFVFVVFGRARIAQLLGAIAMVPLLAGSLEFVGLLGYWVPLLVQVTVIAAIGAFRRDTPQVVRRPWLIAWTAGIVALQALPLARHFPVGVTAALIDEPGLWCVAVVVAAPALLLSRRRPCDEADVGRLLAIASLAAAALLWRAATAADLAVVLSVEDPLRDTVLVTCVVQMLVVAAVGIPAAVVGIRGLHRLPIVSYSAGRLGPGATG